MSFKDYLQYSGAKCQLWKGVRRSDAVTWTRVAGMSDGYAGGPALFYVWNARALVDVQLKAGIKKAGPRGVGTVS